MEVSVIISIVADFLTLVGLVVAIIGIFLTRQQIRQGIKIQRTTFFKDLYQMMYADPHIREAFYLVDYEKFKFDENFAGSKEEQLVDHLLNYFDLLCGLYLDGMLSKQEMNAYEYEFRIVYANRNIQTYIQYLRDIYEIEKVKTMPNDSFVSYCMQELAQEAF